MAALASGRTGGGVGPCTAVQAVAHRPREDVLIIILNAFAHHSAESEALALAERARCPAALSWPQVIDARGNDFGPGCSFAEAIDARLKAAPDRQAPRLVVVAEFAGVEVLNRWRRWLGERDDEVYAFRLPLCAELRSGLTATEKQRYCEWHQRQEVDADHGDTGLNLGLITKRVGQAADRIHDDVFDPVHLVDPDPAWPGRFASERDALARALARLVMDIEHIGSTAVPGIPAKPILDILVTVADLAQARLCIAPLRALGYAFVDYPQNHSRLFFRKGRPRSHHLHLVAQNSREHRDHIDFRQALRIDAELRRAYVELKETARHQHASRRALYGQRKTALVARALEGYRRCTR